MPHKDPLRSKQYHADYGKKYRKTHRETETARAAKWQKANPEKVRVRTKRHAPKHAVYMRGWRRRLRDTALIKLGAKCANPACQWLNADGSRGCQDSRCLQIDHVNSDGAQERREMKGKDSMAIYRKVLADQEGRYQLLCANCNWIKRSQKGEHAPYKYR